MHNVTKNDEYVRIRRDGRPKRRSLKLVGVVGSHPPQTLGHSRAVEREGGRSSGVGREEPGRLTCFVIDVFECEIADPRAQIVSEIDRVPGDN
jgi:hypothetical protein